MNTPSEPQTQTDPPAPPPASPKPPRGPALWLIALLLLTGLVALAIGAAWSEGIRSGAGKLTRAIAERGHEGHDHAGPAGYFTCGMHPWVILQEPGLCPICHMDLTPLDPSKLAGEIAIDPVVTQNIGVRVAEVTTGPLTREVRTVGTVAYDESAVRVANTKIDGFIEELFVDVEGARVMRGDPLFSIYSPQLYAAQEEYLLAYRNLQRVSAGEGGAGGVQPLVVENARRLLESARTRLAYFDVSAEQVRELERSGEPTKTLTIGSPHSGVVVEKMVNEGVRIEPGMPAYRIADLSKLWVIATLYEHQLPYVRLGQSATMSLPFVPGREFEGTVDYIYPYLNEEARQARVRLVFPNPDGRLKPGMFAEVRLRGTLKEDAVLAPREAIVATGQRQVAFVSLGGGRFEPREVRLGVETGGELVEVTRGLEPGEVVVTSGQFLLDSESKMRSALAKMVGGEEAVSAGPSGGAASEGAPAARLEVDAESQAAIDRVARGYLAVSAALAADTTQGVEAALAEVAEAAGAAAMRDAAVAPLAEPVMRAAEAARPHAAHLEGMRELLKPLSAAVIELFRSAPPSAGVSPSLQVANCPMAEADWLQTQPTVVNPYMGARMLRCGSITGSIAAAGGE